MAILEEIMTDNQIMPHSVQAEEVILGTILTEGHRLNDVRDILPADAFYIDKNKNVYKAILSLADKGDRVDVVTVMNECPKLGFRIPPAEIALLAGNFTPMSIEEFALIVVEKYKRRKFFEIGALLQSNAYSEVNDVNDVLAEVNERLDGIIADNRDNVSSMRDAVQCVYDNINRNMGGGMLTGDPTGFSELDKRTGGLQTSDLIVIAADSSQGKTSFAIKLAMNCGCPVAFYSMEMKKEQIAARMISIESGVPANEILFSRLDSGQLKVIDKSVSMLLDKPIYFDDRSTSNIETILSSIRMMKIKYGIRGAVVDYLQILNVNMKSSNKEQQMGDVARRLKNIAKELDIWVMALSQLNRNAQNPVPSLSRLRDSGQIAEAADMVILIYRPEVYNLKYPDPFEDKEVENTAMIDVAKGRNVGLMKFLVGFQAKNTNFHELDMIPVYEKIDDGHGLPF